mmetsp:Transcript_37328/g.76539  ORF Transcript_37328/g.76539 Transcript_37328/m.76539 type:complete len:399 (+) Transcript_37328:106-1302(+)
MVYCQLEISNQTSERWQVHWSEESSYDCHHEDHDGKTTTAVVNPRMQKKLYMVPGKVLGIEKGVGGTWTFATDKRTSFKVKITIPVSGDDNYKAYDNGTEVGCSLDWRGKGGWKNAHRYELVINAGLEKETGPQVREDKALTKFQRGSNFVPGLGFLANGAVALGHGCAGEKQAARAAAIKCAPGLFGAGAITELASALSRITTKGTLACYDEADERLGPIWNASSEFISGGVKCPSLQAVFRAVREYAKENGKVECLQIWCHGSSGSFSLTDKDGGSQKIDQNTFVRLANAAGLSDYMADDAIIWFRTCQTFQGSAGIAFAEHVGNAFPNITFLGHTYTIHALHSGLRGFCANREGCVRWSANEGGRSSHSHAPNTLYATDILPTPDELSKALCNGS